MPRSPWRLFSSSPGPAGGATSKVRVDERAITIYRYCRSIDLQPREYVITYAHASTGPCGPHHHHRDFDLGALLATLAKGFTEGGSRRHGRHRGGPPPWLGGAGPWGWGFGPGGPGGPRGGGRRRRSRGDVRAAILLLLDEEPRNGYQIIQEVEQRSEGHWRPSPGSVYPALAQLEDEGLIAPVADKVFGLTDAGRAHVAEHRERFGAPWAPPEEPDGPGSLGELKQVGMQVGLAAMQVAQAGDEELVARARDILAETRRALYRLLAEDGEDPENEAG